MKPTKLFSSSSFFENYKIINEKSRNSKWMIIGWIRRFGKISKIVLLKNINSRSYSNSRKNFISVSSELTWYSPPNISEAKKERIVDQNQNQILLYRLLIFQWLINLDNVIVIYKNENKKQEYL